MNKTKINWKQVGAGVAAGAIVGATILGGIMYNPNPITQADVEAAISQAQEQSFKQGVESVVIPEPVVIEKEVVKEVEVIKEVVVTDTELIKATCDRLLFDDLAECQQEVKAEDAALKLAWKELEKELADEDFLEELVDEGIIADEDEVSVKKLYKDFEDIEIVKSDYDDEEYEFVLKAKLDDEEANEKKFVLFTVEVSDSEAKVVDYELEG